MSEPVVVINGERLTEAQARVVRLAVLYFDPDCGDDIDGLVLSRAYGDRIREIRRIMFPAQGDWAVNP
jgi:hypothetical protein